MASVPASKRTARNNLPGRLNIPTNSLTPNSSAPSSLSPLIVPISNSNGSSTTHQQQTNELISVMGRITPQPLEDDSKDFFHDESVKVTAPDGEEINPANFRELSRLGEGAGGTVSKVENISTGHIMAKKVR